MQKVTEISVRREKTLVQVGIRGYKDFCLVKIAVPFLRPGHTDTELRLRRGEDGDGGSTPSFLQALEGVKILNPSVLRMGREDALKLKEGYADAGQSDVELSVHV